MLLNFSAIFYKIMYETNQIKASLLYQTLNDQLKKSLLNCLNLFICRFTQNSSVTK